MMDSRFQAQQVNLGMQPLPKAIHSASHIMPPFPAPAAFMATLPQRRMSMAPAYFSMFTLPVSLPSLLARFVSYSVNTYPFVFSFLITPAQCIIYMIYLYQRTVTAPLPQLIWIHISAAKSLPVTTLSQRPAKLEISPANTATSPLIRSQLSKCYSTYNCTPCISTLTYSSPGILTFTFRPRPVWEVFLATAPSTSTAQTLPVLPAPTLSLSAALAITLLPAPTRLHRPPPQSHSLVVLALRL